MLVLTNTLFDLHQPVASIQLFILYFATCSPDQIPYSISMTLT